MGQLGARLRGLGSAATGAVGGLATLAGILGATFTINAVKEAANFNEQLATLDTIARISGEAVEDNVGNWDDQLHQLGENLQDLSHQFGINFNDMAAAEYEFLSTGIGLFRTYNQETKTWSAATFNAAQSQRALEAAGNLAIGGLATQTESVKLLTFALNAYNLNTEKVTQKTAENAGVFSQADGKVTGYAQSMADAAEIISDQFAKAVEIGAVTAAQISSSFSTVAASANHAGIGIDEISAAYATQSVRGVSAAKVTVSMNRALQDLIKPGKGMRDLMEATSKNYAKIADTKGMHVALQEMRNDAEQLGVSFVKLFARQEGYRFALNVTSDDMTDATGNFQLHQRVLEDIRESTGTAEDQMRRRNDTVVRNFAKLKVAFQSLSQAIGHELLEPVNQFLKTIDRIVWGARDWARSNRDLVASIMPLVGAVSGLLALTAGTQGLLFVLSRVAPLVGATGTGLSGLARILGAVTLPLGIIVAALGSFAYLVSNNVRGWGRFHWQLSQMQKVADGVAKVFGMVGDVIGRVSDTIARGGDVAREFRIGVYQIGQAVEDIGPAFSNVMKFLLQFATTIGIGIVNALQVVIPVIATWVADAARTIAPLLARLGVYLVLWVRDAVPKVAEALGQFFGEVGNNIRAAAPVVINAFGPILEGIVEWALSIVPTVVNAIGTAVRSIASAIGRHGPAIAAAFGRWVADVANWFATEAFPAIVTGLGNFIGAIEDWLRSNNVLRTITSSVLTWAGAIILGLFALAGQIAQWVATNGGWIAEQIVGGITDFIINALPMLAAGAVLVAASFVKALIEGIISNPAGVANVIVLLFAASAIHAAIVGAATLHGFLYSRTIGATLGKQGLIGRALSAVWLAGVGRVAAAAGVKDGTAYGLATAAGAKVKEILTGAWAAVRTALTPVVAAVGVAAGAVYGAAVKVAGALVDALQGMWSAAAKVIGPRIAALGFANGTIYARAAAAGAAAIGFATTLLTGGIGGIQAKYFAAGQGAGAIFGKGLAIASGLGAVLLVAEIAKNISGPLNELGRSIHTQFVRPLLGEDNPLIQFGNAWREARATWDWPLGQRNAPEWAGGKPIDINFKVNVEGQEAAFATRDQETFAPKITDPFKQLVEDYGDLRSNPLNLQGIWADNDPTQPIKDARAEAKAQYSGMASDLVEATTDVNAKIKAIRAGESKSQDERIQDAKRVRNAYSAELKEALKKKDFTRAAVLRQQLADAQDTLAAVKAGEDLYNATTQIPKTNNTAEIILADQKRRAEAIDETLRLATLREQRLQGLEGGAGRTGPSTAFQASLKPPPESEGETAVNFFEKAARRSVAALRVIEKETPAIGRVSVEQLADGVRGATGQAVSAARVVANSAKNALGGFNWYGSGYSYGAQLAAGILASIQRVQNAARRLAGVAAGPLIAESPPKEGPLRTIDKSGAVIGAMFAQSLLSTLGMQQAAGLAVAGAMSSGMNSMSLFGGAQETAPFMSVNRSGGSGADYETMRRQTELLGEIAGATRIGAAASARSATRDPRAGGPLAARSTLQSLKHLSISRTRGG